MGFRVEERDVGLLRPLEPQTTFTFKGACEESFSRPHDLSSFSDALGLGVYLGIILLSVVLSCQLTPPSVSTDADRTLEIEQRLRESVGARIWDAALVLCRYLGA
eukprot:6551807-Pyramimonas_sp.AAC.1